MNKRGDGKKAISKLRHMPKIAKEVRKKFFARQRRKNIESLNLHDKNHTLKSLTLHAEAHKKTKKNGITFIKTGIEGLDELFDSGIPEGSSVLVAGGAGSGKTILCMQILAYHANAGEKCFYMSFEEREDKLIEHMKGFGWNPEKLIERGTLKIERINPFEISRSVEAFLAKERGELKMSLKEIGGLIPKGFKPKFIVIDSLTALASAFKDSEVTYRIYIEQLFRYLEKLEATSFLVSETEQIPKRYSKTGVEEFLADGVVVLYNLKHENVRENAVEILKLRGAAHKKAIVAMQITEHGMVVYPEQEVFSDI